MNVRFVVNIKPDNTHSAAATLARFADDFARDIWPFHPRPEVFYLPASLDGSGPTRTSIHAKLIVVAERDVFLGSANFTEAAFERNLEAGVRLRRPELAGRLVGYLNGLISEGVLRRLELG